MGLFSSKHTKSNHFPGSDLVSEDQIDLIIRNSFSVPQLIFKHSTRCSISRYVLGSFVSNYNFSSNEFGAWYLDLLNYRSISNAIATQFDITHESPQLIIISQGKVIAHASHDNIDNLILSDFSKQSL